MSLSRRVLACLLGFSLSLGPTAAQAGQRTAASAANHGAPVVVTSLALPVSLPDVSLKGVSLSLPGVPAFGASQSPATQLSAPQQTIPGVQTPTSLVPSKVAPLTTGALQPTAQALDANTTPNGVQHGSLPLADPFQAIQQAAQTETGAKIVEHARKQGFELEAPVAADVVSGNSSAGSGSSSVLPPSNGGGGNDGGSNNEPPKPTGPSRGPRGALGFLASLLIAQAGVETAGLAVPQLAHELSGSFQASSMLGTVAFLALMSGSLVGGALVDKKGVKPVYLGFFALRAASAVALAATGIAGGMTFPLLVALFGVDYFFLGVSRVSEAVVPTALFSGRGKVAGFSNFSQMVIESMGVIGLTVGGIAIAAVGLSGALGAYAAAIILGSIVAFFTLRKATFAQPQAKGPSPSPREVWKALKDFPRLRALGVAYVLNAVLSAFVYFLVAPAFGLFAASVSGHDASGMTFWTTCLFAFGGFGATLAGAWINSRRDKKLASLGEAERDAAERDSIMGQASGWSKALAGILLAGGWTFAAAGIISPYFALAFMVPFGFTAIMGYVALESTLKTEAPESVRASILGYARASYQLAAAISFPILGWAFDALSGGAKTPSAAAFAVVAAVFAAVALATLKLVRRK